MSVRAISAETGISVGAVHRAKRQLEKDLAQGRQHAAALVQQLPTSYGGELASVAAVYDAFRIVGAARFLISDRRLRAVCS